MNLTPAMLDEIEAKAKEIVALWAPATEETSAHPRFWNEVVYPIAQSLLDALARIRALEAGLTEIADWPWSSGWAIQVQAARERAHATLAQGKEAQQ